MAEVLTGKGYLVTTGNVAALTAGGAETITLIGVTCCNIHETVNSWLTLDVVRSGGVNSEIIHKVNLPINDSLDPLQGKIVLNSSDALFAIAENASSVELSLSYLVET
jgi:hypothetical protein